MVAAHQAMCAVWKATKRDEGSRHDSSVRRVTERVRLICLIDNRRSAPIPVPIAVRSALEGRERRQVRVRCAFATSAERRLAHRASGGSHSRR